MRDYVKILRLRWRLFWAQSCVSDWSVGVRRIKSAHWPPYWAYVSKIKGHGTRVVGAVDLLEFDEALHLAANQAIEVLSEGR